MLKVYVPYTIFLTLHTYNMGRPHENAFVLLFFLIRHMTYVNTHAFVYIYICMYMIIWAGTSEYPAHFLLSCKGMRIARGCKV